MLRYRHTVNVIIKDIQDQICAVKRNQTLSWPNHFSLPGGGVEDNEDLKTAAIREVNEEIGIFLSPDSLKLCCVLQRKPDENTMVFDFFFLAPQGNYTLTNKEPTKHEEVGFYKLSDLRGRTIPDHLEVISKSTHFCDFIFTFG